MNNFLYWFEGPSVAAGIPAALMMPLTEDSLLLYATVMLFTHNFLDFM